MDQLGLLNPALDQDSLEDDDLIVFDSRIHSQSSTRRGSLSPAKRERIEDHYPPGRTAVFVDSQVCSKTLFGPSLESPRADWRAELGDVIQNEVIPHVCETVNQQLHNMNSQFVSSASQAASLFESLQNAMVVLNDQQQVLRQTALDSVSNLHQHNSELARLRQAQSANENSIQQDQSRIHDVSQATLQHAQVMRELHHNVEEGFSRTANVLSQHENRIRSGPRNPINSSEAANSNWWPSSNASQPMDSLAGLESIAEHAVHNSPDSRGGIVYPPPITTTRNDLGSSLSFEDRQMSILDSLNAANKTASAPSYTNFKVSPAPAFNCERYGVWRRELIFWRELYFYVPDLHLLSILGLHSDSTLKQLLIKFHHQTREVVKDRTLSNFVRMLDEYYLLTSQERELKQLDRLMELKKFGSESFVAFWLRYEQILSSLDGSSSHLSPSFLFIRALKSLDLNTIQRTSILTFLECQSWDHTWTNLKKASIKLFCLYGSSSTAGNVKGANLVQSADVVDQVDAVLNEDDQIFVIRRGKGKGGRNRPNLEQTAIRRTQDSMNLKNQIFAMDGAGRPGASKPMICYRCGKSDHTLRNCPLPYTPVLAYAPIRDKDGPVRKTMMAESHLDDSTGEVITDYQPETPVEAPLGDQTSVVPPVTNEDCPEQQWGNNESAWISQWLEQVQDIEEIAVCEMVDLRPSLSVLHAKTDFKSLSSPQVLIDSGASASVSGRGWINRWLLMAGIHTFPPLRPSNKIFRFGNQCSYPSEGVLQLNGRVQALSDSGEKIWLYLTFSIDIINLELPFLLSRQALSSLKSQIDFCSNELVIPSKGKIPLTITRSGHISCQWMPHASSVIVGGEVSKTLCTLFPVNEDDLSLDSNALLKVHKQLGHASAATISRICKHAGKTISEKDLLQVVRDCGCGRTEAPPQIPRINRYQCTEIGETVFADIIYPDSHRQNMPAILFVCAFSRFCLSRFVSSLKPLAIITILLEAWAVTMGMPASLVVDSGRNFMGPEWKQVCDLFDMRIITCPPRAHFQCGIAERHGALISRSFEAMKRSPLLSEDFSDHHLLACVCIAKNLTPLSHCPVAPSTLLTGRVDFLEKLRNVRCPSNAELEEFPSTKTYWKRIRVILELRALLVKADAELVLRNAQGKQLRTAVDSKFVHNQAIQTWDLSRKCWINGARFISDSGRNAIIEHCGKIAKIPLAWIRARMVSDIIDIDSEDSLPLDAPTRSSKISPQLIPLSKKKVLPRLASAGNVDLRTTPDTSEGSSLSGPIGVSHESAMDDLPVNPTNEGSQSTGSRPIKRYFLRSSGGRSMDHNALLYSDLTLLSANDSTILDIPEQDCVPTERPDGIVDTDELLASLHSEFGNFDLSRIPARIFLTDAAARKAVRNEFRGLMRKDSNGIPIGCLVDCWDVKYRDVPKIHTTTVCKVKTNHGFKIRLCLRGDLQEEVRVQFVSAPTVGRDFLKLFLSILSLHVDWVMCTVDITKAFTQGDYVHSADRCIAVMPSYFASLSSSWEGWVATNLQATEFERDFEDSEKTETQPARFFSEVKAKWGLLLYRPLYGSRDAPLRWWLSISTCLRKNGFSMLRSDCCVFGVFSSDSVHATWSKDIYDKVECLILLHVDDILFIGSDHWKKIFLHAISGYDHGVVECLSPEHPILYCGMLVSQSLHRVISLSQKDFYSKLAPLDISSIVKNGKFLVNESKRRKLVKSFVGGCLWLVQCRYDLCFPVCQLASDVVDAIRYPEKMIKFASDAKRVLTRIHKYHHEICYHNFLVQNELSTFPQLTTFSDASFATLRDSGSVESACILFGIPVSRDGTVLCHGHLIAWYTRRIHRVCRSTANSECVALNSALDLTIYLQVILSELLTGHYNVDFLTRSTVLPMMNPFKPSPTSVQMQREFQKHAQHLSPRKNKIVSTNVSMSWSPKQTVFLNFLCGDCVSWTSLSLADLVHNYDIFMTGGLDAHMPKGTAEKGSTPIIHAMALSDCANIIACLSRGNPRTQDKATRLILNAIKDAMHSVNVSFCCAPFNIADVGTKVNATLGIYYRVASSNIYRIGFMSRKDCRQVVDALKTEGDAACSEDFGRKSTRENSHMHSTKFCDGPRGDDKISPAAGL